jgi:hypothetical protein
VDEVDRAHRKGFRGILARCLAGSRQHGRMYENYQRYGNTKPGLWQIMEGINLRVPTGRKNKFMTRKYSTLNAEVDKPKGVFGKSACRMPNGVPMASKTIPFVEKIFFLLPSQANQFSAHPSPLFLRVLSVLSPCISRLFHLMIHRMPLCWVPQHSGGIWRPIEP